MGKLKTGWKLPPLSLPVALMGANVSGKPNFFAIVWFNMLQDDPPLIGAAMSMDHYTRRGIEENGTFSLNIPPSGLAGVVDYCGLHSGLNVDKSDLFDVFYGELETAPMVRECVLNIECRYADSKKFATMELVMGEISEVYIDEDCLREGKPDYRTMDPMLFFMPYGPYFKAGTYLAGAFEVGRKYSKTR